MKQKIKKIWNILQIFILFYVFFVTLLVVNINEYGYSKLGKTTYIPITKSEKKYLNNFSNGDLAIIKNNKIKKEDYIYYYTIDSTEYFITDAKVVDINNGIYITEEGFSIEQDRVVGNKAIKVKFLGFIIDFLFKEIGYLLFIIIPMFIILIYHIYDFSKNMRKYNNIRINSIKRKNNIDTNKKKKNKDNKNKKEDEIEILDF